MCRCILWCEVTVKVYFNKKRYQPSKIYQPQKASPSISILKVVERDLVHQTFSYLPRTFSPELILPKMKLVLNWSKLFFLFYLFSANNRNMLIDAILRVEEATPRNLDDLRQSTSETYRSRLPESDSTSNRSIFQLNSKDSRIFRRRGFVSVLRRIHWYLSAHT